MRTIPSRAAVLFEKLKWHGQGRGMATRYNCQGRPDSPNPKSHTLLHTLKHS